MKKCVDHHHQCCLIILVIIFCYKLIIFWSFFGNVVSVDDKLTCHYIVVFVYDPISMRKTTTTKTKFSFSSFNFIQTGNLYWIFFVCLFSFRTLESSNVWNIRNTSCMNMPSFFSKKDVCFCSFFVLFLFSFFKISYLFFLEVFYKMNFNKQTKKWKISLFFSFFVIGNHHHQFMMTFFR